MFICLYNKYMIYMCNVNQRNTCPQMRRVGLRKTMEVNPKHSIMVELKKKVGLCMALWV